MRLAVHARAMKSTCGSVRIRNAFPRSISMALEIKRFKKNSSYSPLEKMTETSWWMRSIPVPGRRVSCPSIIFLWGFCPFFYLLKLKYQPVRY